MIVQMFRTVARQAQETTGDAPAHRLLEGRTRPGRRLEKGRDGLFMQSSAGEMGQQRPQSGKKTEVGPWYSLLMKPTRGAAQ
jgi:hypothetical protein